MKDIRQVLQQKQLELARLEHQVECLKLATPLLVEASDEKVDVQQLIVAEEQKRNMWP